MTKASVVKKVKMMVHSLNLRYLLAMQLAIIGTVAVKNILTRPA